MADWVPVSPHVSQLRTNPDGSYAGDDDCGPASCVRYLREAGTLPALPDPLPQFNDFREYVDGQPDQEAQGGTSVSDCERYLARYGVDGIWTTNFDVAENAAFAICLIAAAPRLSDGSWPYPESWLGGQSHWILWLRRWRGAYNWFNDPLTYYNGERDTQIDLDYLRGIFAGAICLPDVPGAPQAPRRTTVLQACALKVQPNHTCTALAKIPAAGQCVDLGQSKITAGELWEQIQWTDRVGWVLGDNVAA